MPNNLHVSLTSTTPPMVDVDQTGSPNHVNQSPNSQTITWQLVGNAARGIFVDFHFLPNQSPDPSTIFGQPLISPNGNQLSITDLNNSASTVGNWVYSMSINVGGIVYSTKSILPNPTAVSTNPTIKNL